jgi:hypothetical protein
MEDLDIIEEDVLAQNFDNNLATSSPNVAPISGRDKQSTPR